MRAPKLRTIEEFAEQEIVLPEGPYAGRRFRCSRHPIARLLFRELDSGRWARSFITGPNQDGKTLLAFIITTLWLLFERKETVIVGVPSLDMVADKWTVDLLPAIKASRYTEFLPTSGRGSRNGEAQLIEFGNGSVLRFMTAGGNDQSRAGFSTPNIVVTEADGFDVVGGNSREGSKFAQLERRALAHADRARLIAECTVSFEQARTWNEIQNGSASRICLQCPHCKKWVTPEREHFRGWQDALTEIEAIEKACIVCPECGSAWTNQERIDANHQAVLVHKGQEVCPDGTVTGNLPPTNTLGFRWTVVNSVLNPKRLSMVGGIEWRAQRAADEESAERDVRQSQWALPAKPAKVDVSQLDAFVIMRRTLTSGRGICPENTQAITIGCDIGKRLCHWTAIAWRPNATPHVFEYGRLEVPSDLMDVEPAILQTLRDWRDEMEGWKCSDRIIKPTFVFVDAGNWRDTILNFTNESGPPFFATVGIGIGQRDENKYTRDSGTVVVWSKEGYTLVRKTDGRHYIEVKADRWKSWVHARLHTPMDKPGAMTLFSSNEHLSFAKHLTAEKEFEEFDPREGIVKRWKAISRNNHYLDATMLACVAGYEAGMRLIEAEKAEVPAEQQPAREPQQTPNPLHAYKGRW